DPSLERALALVRFLRVHCPWDRAQTPESLIPHLLEESHEVADAIRDGDDDELEGELGDLLLNLAFQLVLGEERDAFGAGSVTARLEEKVKRRHPHLFGRGERREWEELKAEERKEGGVLDGLARGLDPLTKAHRMQERASGVGFDWPDARGARDKVEEELEEVRVALESGEPESVADELGDLLFAVVNLTRLAGAHPTTALDRANRKFRRRFEALEALAARRGVDVPTAGLEALDRLWDDVKEAETERNQETAGGVPSGEAPDPHSGGRSP
ncbi:MAG TPA: nucleoside triphosphate pyrophosphohydrolase, partial [Longimicrobiales bacterium]|nr:nucleoside triphosphate pyrophosphohydrolase [Longimicrobiales bacterium]